MTPRTRHAAYTARVAAVDLSHMTDRHLMQPNNNNDVTRTKFSSIYSRNLTKEKHQPLNIRDGGQLPDDIGTGVQIVECR